MDKLRRATLLEHLREALNHLYAPDHLRQSPLAVYFGVANRFDTSTALRNILIDAIQSLKPRDDDPARERAWRIHDSLYYCYVQRLNQQAVADQLGLSARHLRREKTAALEELADYLFHKFGLQEEIAVEPGPDPASEIPSVYSDLAWLSAAPIKEPLDLSQALPGVLDLLRPLAARYGAHLESRPVESLLPVAMHPVAFDQILLNLLSVAIVRAACQAIVVSVDRRGWEALVEVQGTKPAGGAPPADVEGSSGLDIAHQLVEMSKGTLDVSDDARAFVARLTFPCVEQVPVLVIDDNQDTLDLFQRYMQGSRYRLLGTRDPGHVLALAEKASPRAIVLDVMMPDVDGWKLLGRLLQHPLTAEVPIVVCTILPQEELALALGANAFLKKPVARQDFLATLDRQIAASGSGSG